MVMEQQMVKVSVEVRSGTASFRVGVQAHSIHKALSMVEARHPQGEVRVASPIEAEGFFTRKLSSLAQIVGTEQVQSEAA
jgi:hypothetical protein